MKKMTALLLAALLLAGMLSGCGGSPAESPSAGEGSTGDGRVEIEFWFSGGKTAVDVIKGIMDDFNASQDVYTVVCVTQADYDETYQKLQSAIAGKKAPDVVLLDAEPARSLSDKNLLCDLNAFLDADVDLSAEDYLDVFYRQGNDGAGKQYAIPAYGTTQILYYNIEAFAAAGVDPESIATWQDMAQAARKIKDAGYDYGWEPMWGRDNLIDAAFSNGAKVFSDDGTQVLINSPEWVEVWEGFRTWIHDDEIMGIHSGGQGWEYWYSTMDDALNGVAGGYTGSSGDQADLDFSVVGAIEQPAWDADSDSAPMAEGLMLSILASSSEAEKQGAYEFIKFFTAPASQAKWSMATGYVAVNTSINEDADYAAYVAENPHAAVPFAQASHGSVYPYDPTYGRVIDALSVACDKVEIDGVSAQEALDEAQATAQAALDEALAG